MKEEYITDQELLELIEDVEEHAMLKAPAYLKQRMLQEIREIDQTQRKTALNHVRHHIRKQMVLYEIKTFSGIAAALVLLFLMPVSSHNEPSMTKEEYYAQQEQGILSGLNKVTEGILSQVNTITDRMCNLSEKQVLIEKDNQKQELLKQE